MVNKTAPSPGGSAAELAIAPLMAVVAVIVWYISDRLVTLGPFDRAEIGWAIVVPLFVLAPPVAGLAERRPLGVKSSRLVAGATALGLGVLELVSLTLTVPFLDCHPVSSPLEVLPRAIPAGLVGTLAYGGAYWVTARQAEGGHPLIAVVLGTCLALGFAAANVLIVFGVLFPPLSCAAPS